MERGWLADAAVDRDRQAGVASVLLDSSPEIRLASVGDPRVYLQNAISRIDGGVTDAGDAREVAPQSIGHVERATQDIHLDSSGILETKGVSSRTKLL